MIHSFGASTCCPSTEHLTQKIFGGAVSRQFFPATVSAHQVADPNRSHANGIVFQGTHRHCLWMRVGCNLFQSTYQVFVQHTRKMARINPHSEIKNQMLQLVLLRSQRPPHHFVIQSDIGHPWAGTTKNPNSLDHTGSVVGRLYLMKYMILLPFTMRI